MRSVFGVANIAEYLVGQVDQVWAMASPCLADLIAGRLAHIFTTIGQAKKLRIDAVDLAG
ncbi:hypothetical protein I553_8794 [Mycobacterium xenopi 4042]|uniref:Uncharacterized protein n=1 Tax=Mycobacterium xenopi 4042 TaxID=1299334 RepID=X8CN99_MYCXE|nr:hypothetical protein I552_8444 [Mycobacterium xenopi 3993]EUA56740.1 hypothetical protein I553_8794 [Mycobacterium xenopi 4042]